MNSIHMEDGNNDNTESNQSKNKSDDELKNSAHQVVSEVKDTNPTCTCEKCGKLVPNNDMAKKLHMDKYHNETLIQYTPGRSKSNKTPNQPIDCEMCEFTCHC